jgi:hypothetical protein
MSIVDFSKLNAPFEPRKISWRVGSTTADKKRGMALAYIDARDVMERLDEVCGPAGWQCQYPHADGKKTVCSIGIKVGEEWIWKADGAGDSDVEAEKGALSDAFKRAAVRWGVGRYLYDVDTPWVELVPAGRSFAIADKEYDRLARILGGAKPQPKPEPQPTIAPADDNSEGQQRFISECKAKIASFAHGDFALGHWWTSTVQKDARRDWGLSKEQVAELKALVIPKLPKQEKVA